MVSLMPMCVTAARLMKSNLVKCLFCGDHLISRASRASCFRDAPIQLFLSGFHIRSVDAEYRTFPLIYSLCNLCCESVAYRDWMNVTGGGNTELLLCHHDIYEETVFDVDRSRHEADTDLLDQLCASLICIWPVASSSLFIGNSGKKTKKNLKTFSNLNCMKSGSDTLKTDLASYCQHILYILSIMSTVIIIVL